MGTKISELVSGSPAAVLTGAEGLELTQSGDSVGGLVSQLRDYVDSSIAERTGVEFTVPTLSSLKALTTRPAVVTVKTGQAAGQWQWEAASSTTADDALVVEPTSGTAGRYKRIYDGVKNAEWFGLSTAGAGAANITALQAALTSGGDIYIPAGTYTLASTQLVPVSNSTIRGVQGQTILSRTGSDVTSYIRPFFNVEDVDNVTFDGLTLDFTVDTSREFGFLLRATALGDTTGIRVRNCTFNNVPNHVQRYCRDVWFEGNTFNGGGASGALCGIATGGAINATTGVLESGVAFDGLVQNVFVYDNIFREIRQEGVDFNQDTSDSIIDGNTFIDCNVSGGVTNEAIDIGGVNSMANGCRRIAVSNNTIRFTTDPFASVGITVKIYSEDITISGNTISSPDDSTSGTAGIVVTDFVRNVTIDGNTIRGFLIGISITASTTDTSINIVVSNNGLFDFGADGINVVTGAFDGMSITGNTLRTTVASTPQQAISLANVVNWTVADNAIDGALIDGILINTTATDGTISGNTVTGSNADGIRVLGANVSVVGNTSFGNGRYGFNITADNVTVVGNQAYNNAQVTADVHGFNIAAGSDYALIVGNKSFDTQGGSATQNGFTFGASDRIVFVGNLAYPFKTTAVNGFGSPTNSIMNPNYLGQTVGVTTANTDLAFTITPQSSAWIYKHTGTLTADRAVTLSTSNARSGDAITITRTGGGAFNLNVGTGPLKALATNTWAVFIYDGSAWYLAQYGAL